ncbi:hypothetical protein CQW23_09444 [Capsicum baccatum]|uniref:Disease resistance R13L4/SHOC-2-like LRR domain-containing protein n=1 Tax=Capsicum baccatum TaxID=33114 RepID=A0A2G2WWT0_CAPBA|nr:hypothetical protein CQW23_09444 [Capsicum baccatum]
MTHFRRLKFLDLSVSSFRGKVPSLFGFLHQIQVLNLRNNSFTGSIPSSFCNMSTLETLNMNFNSLLGQIPKVIGKLIKLRVLKLGGNKLIGFIPLSLSSASRLETLEISYNSLQGNILEEIGNLHNMKVLSIQANQLTGCIPFTIFNISRIKIIAFTGNSLSGSFPSSLGNDLGFELNPAGFELFTVVEFKVEETSKATCDCINDDLEDMQQHIEIVRQLLPKLFPQNPIPLIQTTSDESFLKEVATYVLEGPSHQGKDEHTNELQGKIANSYTFVHVNDDLVANKPLSVSSSLPTCEYIDSFPLVEYEHVVRVDTLVDPLDDRVDSSCKVDLCPPSVEAIVLKGSTLSCENCVDQLVCKTFPPLEVMCDVINESQVSEEFKKVVQGNRSEPEIILCLKLDIDILESEELTCSKSSHGLDNALFRYNVLFEDDITTPTMPSGENYGIACLGGYSLYTNPLWCDNLPLKEENLFLEDESTVKGKECVVLEANPSSTLCDFIVEYSSRWLGN